MAGAGAGFFQSLVRQKQKYMSGEAEANRAIQRTTANANATAALAAARVDNTRADLLPGESKASIGKTQAETGLIGEQAKYFGKEALARIALNRSSAGLNDVQAAVERRLGLSENPALDGKSYGETAMRAYSGYRLPVDDPIFSR